VTQIHRPARLATRAASFRYGGRHHSGIPGDIIPLYPGDFVGIRISQRDGKPCFGFSPEREIGKSRLEIAQNAEDQALWKPHLEDLLARRPFRDLTYPYRHKDGTLRWLRVSGQPVFGPAGEFQGYRGVGTNVTAEIEADEKLAEAQKAQADLIKKQRETR